MVVMEMRLTLTGHRPMSLSQRERQGRLFFFLLYLFRKSGSIEVQAEQEHCYCTHRLCVVQTMQLLLACCDVCGLLLWV